MTRMKHSPTGIEYARLDGVRRYSKHEPDWFGAFVYCLKVGDEESAELIRQRNTPRSDECDDNEHSTCFLKWCGCTCHAFEMAPLEGAPIRSCAEMESEREELEAIRAAN